jgi:hypothetical protein
MVTEIIYLQVREILRSYGFSETKIETWDANIPVPYGASIAPFVAEIAIATGLTLSNPDLFPELQAAYIVGKGGAKTGAVNHLKEIATNDVVRGPAH